MASNRKSRKNEKEGLLTPEQIGLSAEKYDAAIKYLFDRPESIDMDSTEWCWNIDEPEFVATPLEWVKIQTALFARCGDDLVNFTDCQIGMGLNYIMSNSVSSVPHMPLDKNVMLDDTLLMMKHFPTLWANCIGPRTRHVNCQIGHNTGRLGYVCYMWFDVWALPWNLRHVEEFNASVFSALQKMLRVSSREVQVAALHGIGHLKSDLKLDRDIDNEIARFIKELGNRDEELRFYAMAAQTGMVL
jgi:hypothetical protein